jgi:hypothetical protein
MPPGPPPGSFQQQMQQNQPPPNMGMPPPNISMVPPGGPGEGGMIGDRALGLGGMKKRDNAPAMSLTGLIRQAPPEERRL